MYMSSQKAHLALQCKLLKSGGEELMFEKLTINQSPVSLVSCFHCRGESSDSITRLWNKWEDGRAHTGLTPYKLSNIFRSKVKIPLC